MKVPPEKNTIPLSELSQRLVACLRDDANTGVEEAVDTLLSQAVFHGSSDIHLEPWQNGLSLRYRLDGMLHQVALISQEHQARVIARIKVLADLVVYRRDLPQDRRIDASKNTAGRPMRVSTVPAIHGEKTVIRILGDTQAPYRLDALGFPERIIEGIRSLISRPHGGSGGAYGPSCHHHDTQRHGGRRPHPPAGHGDRAFSGCFGGIRRARPTSGARELSALHRIRLSRPGPGAFFQC